MNPDQLTLDVDRPFYFVACRPDGTPIAAVPVADGNWSTAEKWCYLAALDDCRNHPEAWPYQLGEPVKRRGPDLITRGEHPTPS